MNPLVFTKEAIRPRVARFAELKPIGDIAGITGKMPPDLKKFVTSQTVYGLTSPTGSGERNFWDAGAVPAGTPNFGAVYVRAEPGTGASWHVHRYSFENFIALQGKWRIFWNGPGEEEHVDLEPFDMASIPPGAIRRFENVGEDQGLLLAFAYSAEHSLADIKETWLPPCEIERIERFAAGKGEAHQKYLSQMRALSETVAAGETDADQKFTQRVADFVNAGAPPP
jgi:quercetin dioxygenase-like cupin family protein